MSVWSEAHSKTKYIYSEGNKERGSTYSLAKQHARSATTQNRIAYLRSFSMNRQQIDALVKQMNVDTAKGEVDARVQQIVVRLLGDLFQAIEDLDIQPSEV
ncbi:MAG: hypothetical protein E6588_20195, partial [Acinetobacter sp.]|nr:hypothetical protein [Acinetobacter sp.]